MGAISITGKYVTGNVYSKLVEECFKAQVQSNYGWYAGDIGTINTFKEEKAISNRYRTCRETGKCEETIELSRSLKKFMQEHPEYETKEEIIDAYLMSKYKYLEKGQLIYLVDYSTPCGYELATYGGRREVNINQLPKHCERYLDKTIKGYTLFKLTHKRDGLSVTIEPCEQITYYSKNIVRFNTLNEADAKIKRDAVHYRKYYFLIKNDGTKAYMYYPNIEIVNTTNRKTDRENYTIDVCRAYPVYYVGKACC